MPVTGWVPNAVRNEHQKLACEICGATSRLGLHHKDEDRTNNSPENLQTLCPSCHTRLHWEQGKTAWRRHPASCTVCDKPAKRLGLCETHRTRQRRYGSPFLVRKQIGRSWLLLDERTGQPANGQVSPA